MRVPPLRPTSRLIGAIIVLACLTREPIGYAQVAVFDPGIFAQLIRQMQQVQQQYAVLQRQREIWTQLARPLPPGRQQRYIVPPRLPSLNRGPADLDQFGVYTALRQAIEHGDPTGEQWRRAGVLLQRYPSEVLARLTPRQRLRLSREWTHPLSSDGLAIVAVHALAYNREGHRAASQALDRLSARLSAGDRGNIALHQQLVAADLLAAREEHLRNVYVAYLLESDLADLKRLRDVRAGRLNRDIHRRRHGTLVSERTTAETDHVLRDFWGPRR